MLFIAFGSVVHFQLVLLAFVFAIGVLVGLELPLLMRLLEGQVAFKDLVSRVLTFDYIGALAAALMFPLVLVPKLGLVRSVARHGRRERRRRAVGHVAARADGSARRVDRRARARDRSCSSAMLVALGVRRSLHDAGPRTRCTPIRSCSPRPRRTSGSSSRAAAPGFQLFLNGNLQFSSADEYRYHEALVHPGDGRRPTRRRSSVLILGGGDGLALREVLAHPVGRARHARRSRSGDDRRSRQASRRSPSSTATRSAITASP